MHQYSKVGHWVCQPTSAVFLITTLSNQDHRGVIHPDQQVLPNTQKLWCSQHPLFVRQQDKLVDKKPRAHICLAHRVWLAMVLKSAGY